MSFGSKAVVNFLHNCLFCSRFYVYCFSSNNNCTNRLHAAAVAVADDDHQVSE